MSRMKHFLYKVSNELGFDGEITEEVLSAARARLANNYNPKIDSKKNDIHKKPKTS